MDLEKLPIFNMITSKMNWLGKRQQVLAQNVSNADTPNYQAKDLRELDFKKLVSGGALKVSIGTTNPAHFAVGGSGRDANGSYKASAIKDSYEESLSKNSVSLEQEMMKVGQTAMDYETMTNLYKKQVGMFRTAIGRGR